MSIIQKQYTLGVLAKQLALVFIFNTLIALLLTLTDGDLLVNLIFSHCIGFSIFILSNLSAIYLINRLAWPVVPVTIISIIIGSIMGAGIALTIMSVGDQPLITFDKRYLIQPVSIGLFFGVIISYYFFSRIQLSHMQTQLQQQQIIHLEKEKSLSEAKLKLIQAQIEPHFLFNTLATIRSLIDSDSSKASEMLDKLNQYLRTALLRTRETQTTVADELDLLHAYLRIMQLRMEQRLQFSFDVDKSLLRFALPPLLIQPLVENAIQHGLEPKVEGGHIRIQLKQEAQNLCILVEDDGLGLKAANKSGVGLNNIRQRLKSLYPEHHKCEIRSKPQGGVSVYLELPIQEQL
ncbi:MAG: histidine kinase [Gammaproteobacteria bacterium]|nr:histidine kinase [Gammaproteobacteria bacterium]MDH5728068.1 histidine kinase [Gammaproteobacteria bacterium]